MNTQYLMMKKILILLFLVKRCLVSSSLFAQENSLMPESEDNFVEETFGSYRIIHGQSVETIWINNLLFNISHRFWGTLDQGAEDLWGLDNYSNVRLGLAYGITDNFTIGIGRTRFNKLFDGFLKYRVLRQRPGEMPLTITVLGSGVLRSADWGAAEADVLEFKHRLSYFTQVLLGSQITPIISVQLMPTIVHRNLTEFIEEDHTTFALGAAVRVKVNSSISILSEYYQPWNLADIEGRDRFGALGLGINFSTARHAFQLHLSNSNFLLAPRFITNTTDNFFDDGMRIGFHIVRTFGL